MAYAVAGERVGLLADMAVFTAGVVRCAGAMTMAPRESTAWRNDGGGVVTPADLEVERFLQDSIEDRFPDHSFLTEEHGEVARDPDHLWIIDPIDGTVNYLRGLDDYCVCLAHVRAGRSALAAIYRPRADEMFLALRGAGATRNGQPIRVNRRGDPALVVGTGFAAGGGLGARQQELVGALLAAGAEIREPGSASLGLARVAAGMYDAYLEEGLGPWDIIPGALLVEEAGGVVSDLGGQPLPDRPQSVIAACSRSVHDLLQRAARSLVESGCSRDA